MKAVLIKLFMLGRYIINDNIYSEGVLSITIIPQHMSL